jgi:hypothetical protein
MTALAEADLEGAKADAADQEDATQALEIRATTTRVASKQAAREAERWEDDDPGKAAASKKKAADKEKELAALQHEVEAARVAREAAMDAMKEKRAVLKKRQAVVAALEKEAADLQALLDAKDGKKPEPAPGELGDSDRELLRLLLQRHKLSAALAAAAHASQVKTSTYRNLSPSPPAAAPPAVTEQPAAPQPVVPAALPAVDPAQAPDWVAALTNSLASAVESAIERALARGESKVGGATMRSAPRPANISAVFAPNQPSRAQPGGCTLANAARTTKPASAHAIYTHPPPPLAPLVLGTAGHPLVTRSALPRAQPTSRTAAEHPDDPEVLVVDDEEVRGGGGAQTRAYPQTCPFFGGRTRVSG